MMLELRALDWKETRLFLSYKRAQAKGANQLKELGVKIFNNAQFLQEKDPENPELQKLYDTSAAIIYSASLMDH